LAVELDVGKLGRAWSCVRNREAGSAFIFLGTMGAMVGLSSSLSRISDRCRGIDWVCNRLTDTLGRSDQMFDRMNGTFANAYKSVAHSDPKFICVVKG
jgi:hypothetical protein